MKSGQRSSFELPIAITVCAISPSLIPTGSASALRASCTVGEIPRFDRECVADKTIWNSQTGRPRRRQTRRWSGTAVITVYVKQAVSVCCPINALQLKNLYDNHN